MNVYTFIVCILMASALDYKMVTGRTTYDSSSYSDRDENLVNHQKKRLANDESVNEEQSEFERGYDTRYRKFDPDAGYVRRDDSKLQKRDFYDPSSSGKDASIEVILDPRAKKAVAVVENSPSGQAMYDLSGWKSKEEPTYESDQFAPGTQQEQVVNLVYPAERSERKYATEFGSDKSKIGKVMATGEREDTHKRKRNADVKKETSDKRSIPDKRKSEQKTDSKECPPHNNPSTSEAETKENTNLEKDKRDTSQWSPEQLSALRTSLNNVQDTNGEVQNLRSILSSMGLLQDTVDKKRETDSKVTEKREVDKEDEDLNQDNLALKRNNREARTDEDNASPEEPVEKRETEDESNYEEEMNEEFDEKNNVKRSSDSENEEAKDLKDRNKRQEEKSDSQNEAKLEKAKRETGDTSKEVRKNRADETEEEYERRMENQIQAKIDAIKEKVKREIMEEQYKRRYKRNQESPISRKRRQAKDDAKANEKTETQGKVVRRKRSEKMMYGDADEESEDNEFDDNFDSRYNVEKRQAEDESEYYDPVRKRDDEYVRQYYPEARSRRYSEDSNAFHGSRRALKNKGFIENQEFNAKSDNSEKSDSEYFGSLPQAYNGELTRYKRVKRDDPYK